MNHCPNCNHHNRVGVLICEFCGVSIFDSVFKKTRQIYQHELSYQTAPLATGVLVQEACVMLRISGAPTPIQLQPDRPMILGRINAQNPRRPDVDLTAYRAFEMGVSCRHATLHQQDGELVIADLGSTNGTCINGSKLVPHQSYPLRDGDELRLGNLFMRVYIGES